MIVTFGDQPPVYAKQRSDVTTPYPTHCKYLFFCKYTTLDSKSSQDCLIFPLIHTKVMDQDQDAKLTDFHSTLQRALLVVILLTSIRGIKNFTKCNALGGVNCNYLQEWIFGLPLNLKQF